MSNKSTKQPKKLSAPRSLTDIQAAYQQLCANAGQLQYQLKINGRELDNINTQLEAVNREAAARMQLDKDSKAKEESADDTNIEQTPPVMVDQQSQAV